MSYLSRFLFFSVLFLTGCTCLSSCSSNEDAGDSSVVNENITWSECGQKVGEHPCNFTLKDHNGDDFSLYDHYGDVIVLDFSTMWCGFCKLAAETSQEHQDTYDSQGFKYVTILIEDSQGGSVSRNEASQWADEYGITTAPVLIGDRSLIDSSAESGYPITGWPTFAIINRDMVLISGISGWSEESIVQAIESSL